MRLAAIDVGTNTIRLLIADPDRESRYSVVLAAQEITRLGQDLFPGATLKPEPMRRSLEVLRSFSDLLRRYAVDRSRAVGTSALREARNRHDFLDAALAIGVPIDVVSGEEEARLTVLGVRGGLSGLPARMAMIDIGGGSTELLATDGPTIRAALSTGLGSVGLTEAYLRTDPPAAAELMAARTEIHRRLAGLPAARLADVAASASLVGTAGTITTLAALDLALEVYDPARVDGHVLTRNRIESILHRLAALPLAARRRLPGLEPARADIIVAGAAICLGAMERLDFDALTVSDGGLREGILLDLLSRPTDRPSRNVDKGGAI